MRRRCPARCAGSVRTLGVNLRPDSQSTVGARRAHSRAGSEQVRSMQNIVDLGCGTGRWLQRLEAIGASSLTGVDSSAAMLAEARKKCLPSTSADSRRLHDGQYCLTVPRIASWLRFFCPTCQTSENLLRQLRTFSVPAARSSCPICIRNVLHMDGGVPFRTAGRPFEIATFPYTLARPHNRDERSRIQPRSNKRTLFR